MDRFQFNFIDSDDREEREARRRFWLTVVRGVLEAVTFIVACVSMVYICGGFGK